MTRQRTYPWFVTDWPQLPDDQRHGIANMAASLRRFQLAASIVSQAERKLAGERTTLRAVVEIAHGLEQLPRELLDRIEEDRRCRRCRQPLKLVPLHDRFYCNRAHKAAARRRRAVGLAEDAPAGRGKPFSGKRSSPAGSGQFD